jgi:hypothetical protein
MNVSMLLLGRLKARRVEEYEALKKLVKRNVSGGDVLFLPAMNLLYLLGLVEYRPKTDAFEYLGPNEAV